MRLSITSESIYNLTQGSLQVASKENLGSSPGFLIGLLKQGAPPAEEAGKNVGSFVDVRDTALHHVLALEHESAGGQRVISVAGPNAWQDICKHPGELSCP